MLREEKLTEIVDPNNNIIDFTAEKAKRLAPAAAGGGGDDNWLTQLPLGSVFIARQRVPKGQVRPWLATLYLLKQRGEHSAILRCKTPEDRSLELPVHSLDFSRQNEFIETIAILEYEDEKKDEDGADTEQPSV